MRDIFSVANWFLRKETMDHKKLQKLCYYAQAWTYALKDKPLMNAEFQAWVHGPVNPELYRKYAGHWLEDIAPDPTVPDGDFSTAELEMLESVWETYKDSTGNALEVLTHSEPPWIIARGTLAPHEPCTNPIDPEDMKRYYRSIYAGDPEAEVC